MRSAPSWRSRPCALGAGARYLADDEAAELPACPACGTPDTWESRQVVAFRALVGEIDGCTTLTDLAQVGKRLYALGLPHDQAGVAWTHYQLRKAALEGAVSMGAAARVLIARIEGAPEWVLPRLGAELYRTQRAGAAITPAEWRRVWGAYRAPRPRAA
jgi:hypothetical protein